ncbi:ABC transporter substrate-binding protein [Maritimibacter sp. DP1N21-5]|uniref:ABC transporter substrate-binding protein n=1 Tax=Maritimibacter sp. DP1N21-5 TaxID=2836867 RepID=UPI001C48ADB0|nr:ABC transporter substrate-binding protein [Maritimibacter sp. DP1N21-5]MBV7407452.1 ABC transporter substrate-binding protein [Maritimibacter sp. DP1N21-5]
MKIQKLGMSVAAFAAAMTASSMAMAEEYKVVILQSLTGGAAFIGKNVADGAAMAAEELNANGFFGEGNSMAFEVADDATDRTQTLSLITRMAADEDVLLVMGPTSGSVALAGASVANEREFPVMTTTNSMEVIENGPWSFILTQPADVTIPYIADFTANEMGAKNCAIIGVKDNEAYVALQKKYEEMIQERGVGIASVDGVALADSDFSALATKIATADQDCIFIGTPAAQGANIIIQLKQAGLDPETPIIGHNAFASPTFIEKGGAAVEGVYLMGAWVPGGDDEFSTAFAENFEAKTGVPADEWHAVGYSGMQVVANAIKDAAEAGTLTREGVRDALGMQKDIPVVIGEHTYSFDEERVPHFGMKVLTVKDGAFASATE